ncbi:MAG: lamin tail domain-containing protein [Bacteroidetes bacterium]|nr:lamin tail domain-containing protein [Bacteroidota bacterium]
MSHAIAVLIAVLFIALPIYAQGVMYPYRQNFDSVSTPFFPSGWDAVGFTLSTSSPRSSPNCVYTAGNTAKKTLTTPPFDFVKRNPEKLTFWERRSATALTYRLEVRAAIEDTNFSILLARFDTSPSTTSYILRSVDLSSSVLANRSNVRFRWVLLQDNTNSTGTLRIDDVSITVLPTYDVGVSAFTISTINPTRRDSLIFTATISNYATNCGRVPVYFGRDLNENGKADPNEFITTVSIDTLFGGDSSILQFIHPPLKPAAYSFFTLTAALSDENRSNDTSMLWCTIGFCRGDVIINEFLYAPTGDEDEWIELYNTTSDSVNLRLWKVADNSTAGKTTITTSDVIFPPRSYAVLYKDHMFTTLHPGVFGVRVPFAALNNTTSDAIVLYDSRNVVIDSLRYEPSWGGKNGKSLERIEPEQPSTSRSNWQTSDSTIGTPGFENSVARKMIDLAITAINARFLYSTPPQWFIELVVKNIGISTVKGCTTLFYLDTNNNAIAEWNEECVHLFNQEQIVKGDSLCIRTTLNTSVWGEQTLLVHLVVPNDERLKNNFTSLLLNSGYPPSSVVINELQYAPPEGQCEWLELFNRSHIPINLKGWTFADRPSPSGNRTIVKITDSNIVLLPQSYCVIAADSIIKEAFPSLSSKVLLLILQRSSGFSFNNDSDAVVLYDGIGNCIDSIVYISTWSRVKNRSLERYDTEIPALDVLQWSSTESTSGGTPGLPNTTARKTYDIALARATPEYSHSMKHWTIVTTVKNLGRITVPSYTLTFSLDGNRNYLPEPHEELLALNISEILEPLDSMTITTLLPQLPAGDQRILVVLTEDHDEQQRNNTISLSITCGYPPQSIVITELCFDPPPDQCEWFELLNRTSEPINLFKWSFADRPTASGYRNKFTIGDSIFILPPYSYCVIAADSTIFEVFPSLQHSQVLIFNRTTGFGLNNDTDALTLYDNAGNSIDSVTYSANWFRVKQKAIERIDVEQPAHDSTNWSTSESPQSGTPGAPNTVERKNFDICITYPSAIVQQEHTILSLTVRNVGRAPSYSFTVVCFRDSNTNTRPDPSEVLLTRNYTELLAPNDSLRIELLLSYTFYGTSTLMIIVFDSLDQRPNNNTATVSLTRSYPHRSLVINEILFNPLNGQNEWFEVYNRSQLPIDLKRWYIADAPTPSGIRSVVRISDSSYILYPGEYCCIASDSSIFSFTFKASSRVHIITRPSGFNLGNDGDALVLFDHTGTQIDSVFFSAQWHNPRVADTKGRSLERLNPEFDSNDPRSWGTCTLPVGGTPAHQNSIALPLPQIGDVVTIAPNPFSPDGDGYEDHCAIRYSLPFTATFVTIRIFDVRGRLVKTLADREYRSGNDVIIWNGYDDYNRRVRVGIYIVFFEAREPQTQTIFRNKYILITGTKL